MRKQKSVVLSDTQNSNKKAVLTLQEHENGLDGKLRLYNFSRELDGIVSLGLYVNKKVYKAGLTLKSQMLYEFFIDLKGIPDKFSCAVINFINAEPRPILYGSSEGNSDDIYGSIITELSNDTSAIHAQNILDKYDVDFEENEKREIEKEIDRNLCKNDCANCEYKKYFYEHQETTKEPAPQGGKQQEAVFFERLKPQIDKLFENNPTEETLENIIPDSKFVKIDYEDEGDFYVFGLLYGEDNQVKYVCYGVPAVFEKEPPQELSGYPIWTPLDKDNAEGFGYWLTYQDATTGEPIKAIVE